MGETTYALQVGLEPFHPKRPKHKPKLDTPEPASKGNLPVSVIYHCARIGFFGSEECLSSAGVSLYSEGITGVTSNASVRCVLSRTKNRAVCQFLVIYIQERIERRVVDLVGLQGGTPRQRGSEGTRTTVKAY